MNKRKSRLSVTAVIDVKDLPAVLGKQPELADQTNRNSIVHTLKAKDFKMSDLESTLVYPSLSIGSSLDVDLNQE